MRSFVAYFDRRISALLALLLLLLLLVLSALLLLSAFATEGGGVSGAAAEPSPLPLLPPSVAARAAASAFSAASSAARRCWISHGLPMMSAPRSLSASRISRCNISLTLPAATRASGVRMPRDVLPRPAAARPDLFRFSVSESSSLAARCRLRASKITARSCSFLAMFVQASEVRGGAAMTAKPLCGLWRERDVHA